MTSKFIKRVENFTCEKCGTQVIGDGYTNHCPACLWSKHVDIHPGDRAANCGGLMKPIQAMQEKNEYRVLHRCTVCGHEKWNTLVPADSMDAFIAIVADRARKAKVY